MVAVVLCFVESVKCNDGEGGGGGHGGHNGGEVRRSRAASRQSSCNSGCE